LRIQIQRRNICGFGSRACPDPDPDPGFEIFADPDPGFEIFADPDPGLEIFADPDPGLGFPQKFSVFYAKK